MQETARYVSRDDIRGLLILTNYRLVFEVHRQHLLRGSTDAEILNLGLDKVRNVHVSSPMIKIPLVGREVLVVESVRGRREFAVANPATWKAHIANVRARFVPKAFAKPPPPPPPTQVVVNVASPQASYPPPPPPPPQVMFRCRYCNRVYPETDGKCPQCGGGF